jgi:hypothetical protein
MSSESDISKDIIEVPPSNRRGDSGSSTSDNADRFSQEKKEWAAELDTAASAMLAEYYGVDESDVYDFEGLHSGEYDVDDATRALHLLDYAGVDKLVDLGTRIVVGCRYRPQSDEHTVDFSYCVDNGTTKHAENVKHMEAHREGGLRPTVYAFGIVSSDGDTDEQSFDEFHLINMSSFLDAIEVGILNPDGPHMRDGGVEALYYSVDELRETGCIEQSWTNSDTNTGGGGE